jgi:hypothetical protein
MNTTTINVSVNVPKSFRTDRLQQQLTKYARQLVDSWQPKAKNKRSYRHESLCGMFAKGHTEEELIEDYLTEKYKI